MVELEALYIIPHYIPLKDYQNKNNRHIIDMGASDTFKRLNLDNASFKAFKAFLNPNSPQKVAQMINLSPEEVFRFCSYLANEGLLIESKTIPEQYERYDRHLNYYSLNGLDPIKAQDKLKDLTITLIGVGGIGNWIGLNLVGLGIKKIKLIDPDKIEKSNLTRQVLFSEEDVGKYKVDIAAHQLIQRNSSLEIECIKECITENNVGDFIKGTNFVVLSADKPFFCIQKWTNKACIQQKIPLLNVGYSAGDGVMGPLVLPGTSACLACNGYLDGENVYLKENASINDIIKYFRAPSFACLNSLISCMASFEIVKLFLSFGECISINNHVYIDPLTFIIQKHPCNKNPLCSTCQTIS